MATLDIQSWLATVDPDSDEEIYGLYKTVEERVAHGHFIWAEQRAGNVKRCYLSAPNNPESLLLVSDSAIAECLRKITERMEGYKKGMTGDDWYRMRKG